MLIPARGRVASSHSPWAPAGTIRIAAVGADSTLITAREIQDLGVQAAYSEQRDEEGCDMRIALTDSSPVPPQPVIGRAFHVDHLPARERVATGAYASAR